MIFKPSINWLFAFIPISLILEYAHVPAPVLFFSAALAIIPIALTVVRILFEERFLKRELKGYGDYVKRVRYRLIPFIW